MLVTMGQVATVLGNTADASTFASQAAAVKAAFNSALDTFQKPTPCAAIIFRFLRKEHR